MDASLHFATLPAMAGLATAVGVGHTLAGPDHYIPFIALRRAQDWTLRRTLLITLACGVGHCISSVAIAFGAVWLSRELTDFDPIQSFRSDLAAAALIGLGLFIVIRGLRRRRDAATSEAALAPPPDQTLVWSLFVIFVFGPCEWLIPASLAAAARFGPSGLWVLVLAFTCATVATMCVVTALASEGMARLRLGPIERHAATLAGTAIALSGVLIFFGL